MQVKILNKTKIQKIFSQKSYLRTLFQNGTESKENQPRFFKQTFKTALFCYENIIFVRLNS